MTDIEYYKEVFHKYYKSLTMFAVRFVDNKDDLEDLVQETFVAFWENLDKIKNRSLSRAYLYSTLRNKCLNYLKHTKMVNDYANKYNMLESSTDFSKTMIEEETLRIFYQAINQLSDNARKVIYLTLEGYKREEISERLGISVDSVKYHKKNAFKKLKKLLGDHVYLILI